MRAAFAPRYKPEEHWLAQAGIKTVIDIGAHIGEFAQRIRAILPDADLVCFEPLREPFSNTINPICRTVELPVISVRIR